MICQICKKEIFSIGHHLWQAHKDKKISCKDYYDQFIKIDPLDGKCNLEGCDNETTFSNMNTGYLLFCCKSHAVKGSLEKTRQSNMLKYGTTHRLKNSAEKQKQEDSMMHTHGVTNVSFLVEVNKKKSEKLKANSRLKNETYLNWRKLILEKWDQKSEKDLSDIFEKRLSTIIKIYGDKDFLFKKLKDWALLNGVENASQILEVQEKIKLTWSNKTIEELNSIVQKSRNTFFQNHGVDHITHTNYFKMIVIPKIKQTNIERGHWLPDDQISDFELYQRKVYHHTNISLRRKFTKEELLNRKLCGTPGGLQVDHRFSIKEGFLNGILPIIIGSQCNLEFISWEQNDKKKSCCSITKEELFDSYSKEAKQKGE